VRRSLGSLLLSRLSDCTIKAFDSGEAFLAGAQLDASGVLVLDLRMQGMSGLDVFQVLQERASPLVVVFLSGHGDIPVAVRAMQQGAVSWLEKPCSDDRLLEAVRRAKTLATDIARTRRERQHALQLWARVTPREKQVAPLVAQGLSSKEAAQLLTKQDPDNPIDYRTVENHRAKVFAKLEVANSNALLVFLRDNGL
jgi:two-component system, LuxR family, response regulator TtrR